MKQRSKIVILITLLLLTSGFSDMPEVKAARDQASIVAAEISAFYHESRQYR